MPAHDEESDIRGAGLRSIAITAIVLAALWAIDLMLLRTRILAPLEGAPALVPLYAFWSPLARPQALVFVAVAIAFIACARHLTDRARIAERLFLGVLFVSALALPFALFLARKDPADLGREFVFYQNDEFYFDARRILGLGDFLRYYVELMPQLSLHGQHFPPGHATLLYLVSRVFGEGTFPAGITCLICSALAVVFAYLALQRLTGESGAARPASDNRSLTASPSRARQGALLLLAAPSLLDFACTSMDAVFLLFATIAWWIGLVAFGPNGRARHAIATGAALFSATFFSFSALPVGLALGLYGVAAGRADVRRMLGRLAWIGASYAACAIVFDLATGFSISACFSAAASGARMLMDRAAGRTVSQLWPELSFGNALAFALGAGLALVPAAATGVAPLRRAKQPWTFAALVTLFVMAAGGIYFLETERIWLFALPWLAAVAVAQRSFTPMTLRILLAAGLAQALVMEVLLVTLW